MLDPARDLSPRAERYRLRGGRAPLVTHFLKPLPLGRAGTTGAVPTSRLSAPGSRLPGADGRPSGFDRRRRSLPAVRGCSLDRSGLNSARPALAGYGHDRGVGQHGASALFDDAGGPGREGPLQALETHDGVIGRPPHLAGEKPVSVSPGNAGPPGDLLHSISARRPTIIVSTSGFMVRASWC